MAAGSGFGTDDPPGDTHVDGVTQGNRTMPVAVSQPGVPAEEIQGGVRTIIGVATSITAFAVRNQRARADGRAQ